MVADSRSFVAAVSIDVEVVDDGEEEEFVVAGRGERGHSPTRSLILYFPRFISINK